LYRFSIVGRVIYLIVGVGVIYLIVGRVIYLNVGRFA